MTTEELNRFTAEQEKKRTSIIEQEETKRTEIFKEANKQYLISINWNVVFLVANIFTDIVLALILWTLWILGG